MQIFHVRLKMAPYLYLILHILNFAIFVLQGSICMEKGSKFCKNSQGFKFFGLPFHDFFQ